VAGAGRTEKFHQPHVNVQKSLDLIGLEIFPSFASTRRQPRQWSGLDFLVLLYQDKRTRQIADNGMISKDGKCFFVIIGS